MLGRMTHIHFTSRYRRAAAGAVAAVALGGLVAACGSSSDTTAATTGSAAADPATPGAPSPGLGTDVTGTAATKAKKAALAKYPGTVERIMQLPDGSYVLHVIRNSGDEVHVKVSKTFAVTGVEQRMPGRGAPPSTSGTPTQQ
jgi:hypothetical protein